MLSLDPTLLRYAQSAYHSTVRLADPATTAAAGRIMSGFSNLQAAQTAITQDVAPPGR